MTLSQVWERVPLYNKEVQDKKLNKNSKSQEVRDASISRLPTIDAQGEYARVSKLPVYNDGIFNTPDHIAVLPNYYKVGASAYLNLYEGNKANLFISKNKTNLKIASIEEKMETSEQKLKAAFYFLEIQRYMLFIAYLGKDIAAQQKQLLKIKEMQKNGVVLRSDILRAELKLSRQKLGLLKVENDRSISNEKLNTLIGLADDAYVKPVGLDDYSIEEKELGHDYLSEALISAHQIEISAQEKEIHKLDIKMVKANQYPKIGLFANYAYSYPQIFLYPYQASTYGFGMAGIKMSYSIASLYNNRAKEKIADIAYEVQELDHVRLEDKVREDVQEAFLRLKENREAIRVMEVNVNQALENQRIVQNTYFNNTALITDLLDADSELLQTQFDYASARIALQLQYYTLLNITGKL